LNGVTPPADPVQFIAGKKRPANDRAGDRSRIADHTQLDAQSGEDFAITIAARKLFDIVRALPMPPR